MTRKEREGLKVSGPLSLSTGFNLDEKSNGVHDESENKSKSRRSRDDKVTFDYHGSPYAQYEKKGFKYGGKAKEKKEEILSGPANNQVKSEGVEVLEYSIYKKDHKNWECIRPKGLWRF